MLPERRDQRGHTQRSRASASHHWWKPKAKRGQSPSYRVSYPRQKASLENHSRRTCRAHCRHHCMLPNVGPVPVLTQLASYNHRAASLLEAAVRPHWHLLRPARMYNGLPSTHADWLTPQTAQPRLHGRMNSYPSSCVCMITSTGQHVAMRFALLSGLRLFLPSRVQSPGCRGCLKTRPSVLSSCSRSEAKQSADAPSCQPNETTG